MTNNANTFQGGQVSGEGFLQHSDVPCANGTAVVKQGDLVYLSSGIAKPLGSDANAATLLGVALQPSAPTSNLDNSSVPVPASLNVGYAGIWMFDTLSGDTFVDGEAVYYTGNAQKVTRNSSCGSHAVGCVRLKSGQSSVVGASGVKVPVLVYSRAYVTYAL